MLKATTLVHKGGMEIAIPAIKSFTRHFANRYSLHIHTDGSTDDDDNVLLLKAATGMQAKIITAADRKKVIQPILAKFPKTDLFLQAGGIYSKLEIPMFEQSNYFFFDSDIIWLCPVNNLSPTKAPNAFSTESWSWYNGVMNDRLWIASKTPRRVNSGFYFLGQEFPYEKMEKMLEQEMFNTSPLYATDQEIFAYLFNKMEYYHPEDLKRSRLGITYSLSNNRSAALHFPGRMWEHHLNQIEALVGERERPAMNIRYQPAVALTSGELFRMRAQVKLSHTAFMKLPLNLMRKLRKVFSNDESK